MTPSPDDEELRDDALHDEIVLVGELIVAVSGSDEPLTAAELDEILGVTRSSAPMGSGAG